MPRKNYSTFHAFFTEKWRHNVPLGLVCVIPHKRKPALLPQKWKSKGGVLDSCFCRWWWNSVFSGCLHCTEKRHMACWGIEHSTSAENNLLHKRALKDQKENQMFTSSFGFRITQGMFVRNSFLCILLPQWSHFPQKMNTEYLSFYCLVGEKLLQWNMFKPLT